VPRSQNAVRLIWPRIRPTLGRAALMRTRLAVRGGTAPVALLDGFIANSGLSLDTVKRCYPFSSRCVPGLKPHGVGIEPVRRGEVTGGVRGPQPCCSIGRASNRCSSAVKCKITMVGTWNAALPPREIQRSVPAHVLDMPGRG